MASRNPLDRRESTIFAVWRAAGAPEHGFAELTRRPSTRFDHWLGSEKGLPLDLQVALNPIDRRTILNTNSADPTF